MAKTKHWKKIRQTEFSNIKKLVDAKIPTTMISKATGRSYYVIQLIEKAGSLEEYHDLMRHGAKGGKKQSNASMESFGNVKPEERFPRIVTLLDSIVKQQLILLQDVEKIKRRLLISN